MNDSVNKLQLELHVEDFEPIERYYKSLGFKTNWIRPAEGFKGYLVMSLNGNTLCFWAGNQEVFNQPHFKQFPKDTPRGYGIEIVIMIENIDEFYDQVKNIANVVEPLAEQPWGLRDFRVVDPGGYYLRFTSEHNVLDQANAVE